MFSPNKNVETKNSTIAWESPDSITEKKLLAALHNKNKLARNVTNLFFLLIILFLLFIIAYCIILAIRNQTAILFYMIGILIASIILGVCIYNYLKGFPYMYPEKQAKIFIFRTKCSRVGQSSRHNPNGTWQHGYFAFFNSKAEQICVSIPYKEYASNPVSKEYIFYKFNNRAGNKWINIAASELDKY